MRAIEFEAQAHNGTIKLPEQYTQWTERSVRVTLLATEPENKPESAPKQRNPHPAIAGKGKTLQDLVHFSAFK